MAINFNTRPIYKDIVPVTIDGQAMVKIPAFYVKYGTVPAGKTYAGKKMHLVSERALTGYHLHPAFIRDGKEMDCFYIGAYEGYNAGNNVCGSAANQTPWVNLGGFENAKSYCAARNTNANDTNKRGWHLQNIYEHAAISMLMLIELGTPDVQNAIGAGNSNSSGAVKTGTTNAVWRGLHEWWGNLAEHVDGFKTDANKVGWIFDNKGSGNYVPTGVTVGGGSNGWITEMSDAKGTDFDLSDVFVPSAVNGTESNGTYSDYCWSAANSVLLQNGTWEGRSNNGTFTFRAYDVAASSDPRFGLRLAKYSDT